MKPSDFVSRVKLSNSTLPQATAYLKVLSLLNIPVGQVIAVQTNPGPAQVSAVLTVPELRKIGVTDKMAEWLFITPADWNPGDQAITDRSVGLMRWACQGMGPTFSLMKIWNEWGKTGVPVETPALVSAVKAFLR